MRWLLSRVIEGIEDYFEQVVSISLLVATGWAVVQLMERTF